MLFHRTAVRVTAAVLCASMLGLCASADGGEVTFIPYFRRNNRVSDDTADSKMAVWLEKAGWNTDCVTEDSLYGGVIL